MELNQYLESLGRDLAAVAATGGPDITRAADLLAGALDASARLCLLEALSDAAAEVSSKLDSASVEVRLRGREADLVVTPLAHPPQAVPPPPVGTEGADLARITLRLPEWLKEAVEQAAAVTGVSVNAWLVDAIAVSVQAAPSAEAFPDKPKPPGKPKPPARPGAGQRLTGFAQA